MPKRWNLLIQKAEQDQLAGATGQGVCFREQMLLSAQADKRRMCARASRFQSPNFSRR